MAVSKTKAKLVDVARQLFAKMGVENTTMNDIALASKKGRRTLYTIKENNENQRIARIAAEQMFFQSYSRYLDLFRFTPEERYLQLLKKCPAILQMVSLKEIASYLKITPIHMSRIRRKQSFDNKK